MTLRTRSPRTGWTPPSEAPSESLDCLPLHPALMSADVSCSLIYLREIGVWTCADTCCRHD